MSYGISENSIKKGCLRFRNKKSQAWENIKDFTDRRKVWIKLDSIPNTTKTKYNIPSSEDLELQRLNVQREKENILSDPDALRLTYSFNEEYADFYQLYWDRLAYSQEKQLKYAKTYAQEHAYWVQMVHITGTLEKTTYGKVSFCFEIHKALLHAGLITLLSNVTSLVHFKTKLKTLRKALYCGNDGVDVIIHKGLKLRNQGTKIKDFHRGLILAYLQYEQIYAYRVVADLVNHHSELRGYKKISESSIKNLMSTDNKFRTLVDAYRYGKKHFNDNVLPHTVRELPKFPANVWMIDGTPIQFYCHNESRTKIIRLYLFVVIDVCSRKVVGFDIAYSETRFNILNALKLAVMSEGYLPSEIVSDNASANNTEEITDLKEQMTRMGITWRNSKVGNAQDKSYVERFFGVFQTMLCSLSEGYMGEGITSKRHRPNSEFVQKWAKENGLLLPNEMRSQIAQHIVKYNETSIANRKSPNQIVKELPRPNAIEMDSVKTALMFWSKTSHTVKRGMIKFKVNKIEHIYEIADHEIKLQLQNKKVAVRYNENDLDWIMLFDYNTNLPICECKKSIKIQIAKVDQDEKEVLKIIKSEAKKKSYKQHIDSETSKILDKALNDANIDELELTHPLSIAKNQRNDKESEELLELYYSENHISQDEEYKREPKPIGIVRKSDYKDAHDLLLTNKSSKKSSLKPLRQ